MAATPDRVAALLARQLGMILRLLTIVVPFSGPYRVVTIPACAGRHGKSSQH
jgi:hypothetical protein